MRPALPLSSCPATALALSACAVAPPPGPSVMALPGQGKNFASLPAGRCRLPPIRVRSRPAVCSPDVAATNSAVGSAVVGTALGAAAGAAIGSVGGAAGAGAAIGAATGLLAGSAVGANNAAAAYGSVQQAYDVSYTQCMTAHGRHRAGTTHRLCAYPYPAPAYPPTHTATPIQAITELGTTPVSRRRIWRRLGLGRRMGVAWRRLARRWVAPLIRGTQRPTIRPRPNPNSTSRHEFPDRPLSAHRPRPPELVR